MYIYGIYLYKIILVKSLASIDLLIFPLEGIFHFELPSIFYVCQSSDEDLIFLSQASIGMKNDCKRKVLDFFT